jgi:hypothetical protein
MTKKEANKYLTYGIILLVIIVAIAILTTRFFQSTDDEIAECIGKNSVLYIQTGCIHCENQLAMFGNNKDKLNIYNCMDDNWETCREKGLKGTPTWEINNQFYVGKQSIEKLKELTNC